MIVELPPGVRLALTPEAAEALEAALRQKRRPARTATLPPKLSGSSSIVEPRQRRRSRVGFAPVMRMFGICSKRTSALVTSQQPSTAQPRQNVGGWLRARLNSA